MSDFPRITFGVIVLNGEPFSKYCLRQLYPHAHQIIVVEGGSSKAAAHSLNGHSIDGTLEALHEFKANEDPEDKVTIVTKEGYWSEKDEQSQAYAALATGDYLWQVDIDEFYRHEDIAKIKFLIRNKPEIDAVSFSQLTFWGAPEISVDSFRLRSDRWDEYHRLFKWKPGYTYATHRPPTVLDENGVDLRKKNWLNSRNRDLAGIHLYHYSLLFPVQVIDKCRYYSTPSETTHKAHVPKSSDWANESYLTLNNPFRVHNVYESISWLKRFHKPHPEEVVKMWKDASDGKIQVQLRDNSDADVLLSNRSYCLIASILSATAEILRIPLFNWMRRLGLYMIRKTFQGKRQGNNN